MPKKQARQKRWVDGAVVYQIYPRSFYDANADGVGDIPGIIEKLSYLKDLGVTAVWLSPFYPSPMADFGYDVADYCDVDPIFGSLEDMKRLLKEAHKKGIKLIVDLVPNHSSDEHEWFRQSRQSKEGEFADWYVWHDPKGFDEAGKPIAPNNWIEVLTGGPAWEWEPARQQFYLHSFDVRQPDLNWENPKVRAAIKDVMRFWLDMGVDGFRVDAVHFIAKDPQFRDEPENPHYDGTGMRYAKLQHPYNHGWPPAYDYLRDMADVLKEPAYRDSFRFMITEAYPDTHEPIPEYLEFYTAIDPEVSAPFNFEGIGLPWESAAWKDFLRDFHTALDTIDTRSIPSYAFGNHDQHRIVSRIGEPAARSAAVMLLSLPGMVFIYNGDEIGMHNGDIPPEYVQDPGAEGGQGRDPERTPMQWSAGKNAGFSKADTTWLPIAHGYQAKNVEVEAKDEDSFLNLYKQLIALRHSSPALKNGSIKVLEDEGDVLAFERSAEGETLLTLINFSNKPQAYTLETEGKVLLSSDAERKVGDATDKKVKLAASEAIVLKLGK